MPTTRQYGFLAFALVVVLWVWTTQGRAPEDERARALASPAAVAIFDRADRDADRRVACMQSAHALSRSLTRTHAHATPPRMPTTIRLTGPITSLVSKCLETPFVHLAL